MGKTEWVSPLASIDFEVLAIRLFDPTLKPLLDNYLMPEERVKEREIKRSITDEGIAICEGPDGDITKLTAILLGDQDNPTRVPFIHSSADPDFFSLNVHGPNTVGFFISYDASKEEEGTVRGVTARAGVTGIPHLYPLAGAFTRSARSKEVLYDMTHATVVPRPAEQKLIDRFGLCERFGFNPEHTRGILQVVRPLENFPLLIKPGISYQISSLVTKPTDTEQPDVLSTQARFRINVNQLKGK